MLTLTPNATQAIEDMLTASGMPESAGLRIAPTAPSTADAADGRLRAGVATEPDDGDQIIEEAGVRVFLDDAVAELLDDKLLDADIEGENVRFALHDQA
jgi:iron-sulfur cluster assembly protein